MMVFLLPEEFAAVRLQNKFVINKNNMGAYTNTHLFYVHFGTFRTNTIASAS